jgi:ABC-2 type transport system ATP-binding protein
LCDRILLIAKGRKILDGTLAEARRTIPRRVQIETVDDIAPIRELGEVLSVSRLTANGAGEAEGAPPRWELKIRESADPQSILQTCFARGIRLRSFNQSEPTLHDVFVHLVGPEAKEAGFR